MNDNQNDLIAFALNLLSICYLVTIGAVLAYFGKNLEAIGVAAAVTGLIGVIKLPAPRTTTITNTPDDPVPVAPAE